MSLKILTSFFILNQYLGSAGKVGFSKAMSSGWITLDKTGKPPLVKKKVATIEDTVKVNFHITH